MGQDKADSITELVELIKIQRGFFRGCGELDEVYSFFAYSGTLTEKRRRPPRRGWTRADLNRCKYELLLEDYFENLDRSIPHSLGPRQPGNVSTRIETAFRVLPWQKNLALVASKAVKFCKDHIAFTESDAAAIRIAVESHIKWLDTYVHMSEERPIKLDQTNAWLETLDQLEDIAKTSALVSQGEKLATQEDLQRLDRNIENRRFFSSLDDHCEILDECVAAWERSGRSRKTIPPTLDKIADFVSHKGEFNYSILASLEAWLLKNLLPKEITTREDIAREYFALERKHGGGRGTKEPRFIVLKPMFEKAGIEHSISNLDSITKQFPRTKLE